MSVTIAILIFFSVLVLLPLLAGAVLVVGAAGRDDPHARVRACNEHQADQRGASRKRTLLREAGEPVGRSLDQTRREALPDLLLHEGRTERGPRDLPQRLVVEAELLGARPRTRRRSRHPSTAGRPSRASRAPRRRAGRAADARRSRVEAERDVAGRTYLEHRAPLREFADELGILAGAHPVADPADAEREAAADAVGPGPLAGVTVRPSPASRAIAKAAAKSSGGKPASSPPMPKPVTYGCGALDGAAGEPRAPSRGRSGARSS